MISKVSRAQMRQKKHRRLRNHIVGTAQRPRLCVFRSNNHMYAQIIDDTIGNTLVSASTLQKEVKAELENQQCRCSSISWNRSWKESCRSRYY